MEQMSSPHMLLIQLLGLSSILLPAGWAARLSALENASLGGLTELQADGSLELDFTGQALSSLGTNSTNLCLTRHNFNDVVRMNKTLIDDKNRTCSIVGSGGSLVGRQEGLGIDAHTLVIRLNQHRTRGFEQDVGKRTDLRIFYPESSEALRPGGEIPKFAIMVPYKDFDNHWYSCIQTENLLDLDSVCLCAHAHKPKKDSWKPSIACNGRIEFSNLGIVTRLFQEQQKSCYESAGLQKRPSEGFTALMFALAICDKVALYGFGPKVNGQCRYDGPEKCAAIYDENIHDFTGEHQFYARLAKAGIIELKTDKFPPLINWRRVVAIVVVVAMVVLVVVLGMLRGRLEYSSCGVATLLKPFRRGSDDTTDQYPGHPII